MLGDFLASIYEAFNSLPLILKLLIFFFGIVPNMVLVQILIMPLSMLLSILDVIMNLACKNCSSWEPDFLLYLAFFPIVLIWIFGENTFSII